MGRFAQATRLAKTQLRSAAQDTKALKGRVGAEQAANTRAYLLKMQRRLPSQADIRALMERVQSDWDEPNPAIEDSKARWNPPDAAKGEHPTKGSKSRDRESKNTRQEILRDLVLHMKRLHQVGEQIQKQAKQDEEASQLLARTATAILRMPSPTMRSTAALLDEGLGLTLLFIAIVEKFAKGMKGG